MTDSTVALADPAFAAFMDLHRGLPRQGPGSDEITRRAFAALPGLPPRPRVLDVGCGSGPQTLELARLCEGRVTSVDLHAPFLRELRGRAASAGVADRVDPVCADMTRLPFAPATFDLVWSEGAIYIAGFESALRDWRLLLRDGGGLAVTECTWLRGDPPEELRRFFAEVYPAMKDDAGNLEVIRATGLVLLAHFALPASCWWAYYAPIEEKLEAWLAERHGDAIGRGVVETERAEIALYRRYSDWYGYVFYVMRAP